MSRVIDPTTAPHQHNHSNQIVPTQPVVVPMVVVQGMNGQPAYIPYSQWQQQQGLGQQPPATNRLMGLAILAGFGLVGYWAYKKFYKDKQTEYYDDDRGSSRRSRKRSSSRMMSEFQKFLEDHHASESSSANESMNEGE